MSQVKRTNCYIEEYKTDQGGPGFRLREKETGRKVDLGSTTATDKQDLVLFLTAATVHRDAMPDVFSKDGDLDCVVVSGEIDFDAPDEIRYVFNDQLSCLFG
jgi:hypothetical protein